MGNVRDNIATNIKAYREAAGLSQRDLASMLDVGHTSVSNWELGLNSPSIEMLLQMCKLFDVKIETMYGVSDEAGQRAQEFFSAYLRSPREVQEIIETALKLNRPIPARPGQGGDTAP